MKIGYKGTVTLKTIGVLVSILMGYLLYQKETNVFTLGFILFALTMIIFICIYGIVIDISEHKEKISKQNSIIKDIVKTDDDEKQKHRDELLNNLFNGR